MDALFNLLFVALIAWFVLRAASRASQAGKEMNRKAEGLPDEEAPSARRLSPIEEIRRRMLAEAERWEAERRRLEVGQQPTEVNLPAEVSLPAEVNARAASHRVERHPVDIPEAPSEHLRPDKDREEDSSPGATRRRAHVAGFPEFPDRSPEQRAVLYAEILGPPKGMEGAPF